MYFHEVNYLAHAYLSFRQPELLVGNMISDFVKGKKQYDYPIGIQKGIRLHRAIDTFTDAHPSTAIIKHVFKPAVGAYAPAFADVVYDYYLANDPKQLSEADWKGFAEEVYQTLEANRHFLPDRFAQMLPYMREHNWLYHYRLRWGIQQSFGGIRRRAKYLIEATDPFEVFQHEDAKLQTAYDQFFPDIYTFCKDWLVQNSD